MIALRLLAGLATAYLTVGAFFYFEQTKLLFPAPKDSPKATPADAGLAFEDLRIGDLHAWWIPHAEAGGKTAVMFHGNGYVLEDMAMSEAPALHFLGVNLLLVDYRGYGSSSPITPDESTILEDADAALNYLLTVRKIAASDVFLIGRSIGSGPVVYLASKHSDLAGLILESPFSSVDDVARGIPYLRIYPVALMLRTHFYNYTRIGSVRAPLFLAVGSADDLTPPWMAREIFARANEPKHLLVIEKAGHNDLIEIGGAQLREALRAYLSGKVNR